MFYALFVLLELLFMSIYDFVLPSVRILIDSDPKFGLFLFQLNCNISFIQQMLSFIFTANLK